jgi:hypothetical protein
MNALLNTDFIADPLRERLIGAKRAHKGFDKINCPICVQRGERRADRKRRGAMWITPTQLGYKCYNCGMRARYSVGGDLSKNFRSLLEAFGLSDSEVMRITYHAFTLARMAAPFAEELPVEQHFSVPNFAPVALPENSQSFQYWAENACDDPDFIDTVAYLYDRGEDVSRATTYYWTPIAAWRRRVIIPFYFQDRIVGYTGRAIDDANRPKYLKQIEPNYLFNNHVLHKNRKYVILMEGPMDALAIDGVATLGAELNETQIHWIKSSNKIPVLVPDRDSTGARMIDTAMQHGWMVSFPRHSEGAGRDNWWQPGVKDVAEATRLYGRLYVLQSIMACATANKLQITLSRKSMI